MELFVAGGSVVDDCFHRVCLNHNNCTSSDNTITDARTSVVATGGTPLEITS